MRLVRAFAVACAALLATCTDPVAPAKLTAPITIQFAVASSTIASVLVEVTASDLPTTLQFNLTVASGVASGVVQIPVGSNRTITVHAYDVNGLETHRGKTVINVTSGSNSAASIVLLPLTGSVPITATVGAYVVVITPASDTVSTGGTVQLTATVTDGVNTLAVSSAWASLSPFAATVDSTGRVHGLLPGLVTIVATYGSSAGSAQVLVSPSGLVPPSVTIAPMNGPQHMQVLVDYALTHPTSDTASILVEYSVDGGGSWHLASAAAGTADTVHGLASSPSGVHHLFHWNALKDSVATTGPVSTVRLRLSPTGTTPGIPVSTASFTVNNNLQQVIAVVGALIPRNGTIERTTEIASGDLIADAMRQRAGTQLAWINGGGIRSSLPSSFVATNLALRRAGSPPFDLVMGDVYTVLPFGNRMVTRTVTGAQLWAMLEWSVRLMPAANGGFMQISGFTFSYSLSAPSGARVQSVLLNGITPILNSSSVTYTMALTDFNNGGGDGYAMIADGTGTPHEIIADIVLDYLVSVGTISGIAAWRITQNP
ncbi:MAG: 5'-nucleotidase C-terminal domain-containing protein [Gemmatimonadetes bacterium]|nr:5'-nucleotidase C-terminal domain-containing protein [Gemmatimonadota bacterium]